MPKFIGIIPARYASTRFPGKPLVAIAGKTMIQRVYEQASKAELDDLFVATDHTEIYEHVIDFGGKCLMTSATHQSGTERCFECAKLLHLNDDDVIINIQGDEPFIKPTQISLLFDMFDNAETKIGTLIKKIETIEELEKNSVPKVVFNHRLEAIYFSRSIIPFPAKKNIGELIASGIYFKHIGIYAYRAGILKQLAALPISLLEQTESLEQLRWIEHGFKIKTAITNEESIAIDTPDDLSSAMHYLDKK